MLLCRPSIVMRSQSVTHRITLGEVYFTLTGFKLVNSELDLCGTGFPFNVCVCVRERVCVCLLSQ